MQIHYTLASVSLFAALAGCLASAEEVSSEHLDDDPPATTPAPAPTPLLEHRTYFNRDVAPTSTTTIFTDGTVVYRNQYRTMSLAKLSDAKLAELGPWVAKFGRFDYASATQQEVEHLGIQDCATGVTESFHAFLRAPEGTVTEQKIAWVEDCHERTWNRAFTETQNSVKILRALTTLESLR